jgi:hypothetical protein
MRHGGRGSQREFCVRLFLPSSAAVESPGAMLPADQRSKFLAYVKRQRPISRSLASRVSVGDVLPDSGLLYYDIPLSYGLGLFRFTVVDGETVIVDPRTSRAVGVID